VTLYCYVGENAANFTVGLTNVHPLAKNPEVGNYNVCGQYPGLVPQGATVKLRCENTDLQPARYVIVQFPSDDQFPTAKSLRLCELDVYTEEGSVVYRVPIDAASLLLRSRQGSCEVLRRGYVSVSLSARIS